MADTTWGTVHKMRCIVDLFTIVLLFTGFVNTIHAQSIRETSDYAIRLFKMQEYRLAAHELERVLYFDKQEPDAPYYLAECYLQLNEFEFAEYYYHLAYSRAKNDSVRKNIHFRQVALLMNQDKFDLALLKLHGLSGKLPGYFGRKRDFYMSLCYFQINEFQLSQQYYTKLFSTTDSTVHTNIGAIFSMAQKNHQKKYWPYMIYSAILPGLGQTLLGEYEAGINSLGLNAAFITLYIYTIQHVSPIDAVFAVMPWFHRYYQGGMLQTRDFVNERKAEQKVACYNTLIKYVIRDIETANIKN